MKNNLFPENFWGSATYFLGTFVGVEEVANKEKRKIQSLPVLDILSVFLQTHSLLFFTLHARWLAFPGHMTAFLCSLGAGWFLSVGALTGD